MPSFFDPTPEEREILEKLADEIPGIQQTFVTNHGSLSVPDRGAHQQQLAGSKVLLTLADQLPRELDGLGLFRHDGRPGPHHVGIGRISTGLGCPHAETDADFLGLLTAFRTSAGQRCDFITINDPTSPTDTPEEFFALLKATADTAGTDGVLASQARLLVSLARHAGLRAPAIAFHVAGQTQRTVRSRSAYQQYWTGIVRARDVLGKFTFVPVAPLAEGHDESQGPKHLTDDWRKRQNAGPLEFRLHWVPFVSDRETPLDDLTSAWKDDRQVVVGTVTFPKTDSTSRDAKLVTLLASELGANPGNWLETSDGPPSALPATRFTAARSLAYRAGQKHRNALPEELYRSFFDRGEISQELTQELVRRYQAKRAVGHWVPEVGDVSLT